MELLEKRLAPAGVVAAVFSGGTLKLTGDAADNGLVIVQMSADLYEISGTDGTRISLNGGEALPWIRVAAPAKAFSLDLKAGDDTLTLGDIDFGGSLSVNLGAGYNALNSGSLDLGGSLSITGGAQDDIIRAEAGGDLRVGGSVSLALGAGGNVVSLKDLGAVDVGGAVSFTGGAGWHELELTAESVRIGGGLTMIAGTGSAGLGITAQESLRIGGSLHFQSASSGEWSSNVSLAAAVIEIEGGVQVRHSGYGVQATTYLSATESLTVGGAVTLSNVGSTYVAATELSAPVISTGGNLTITNGRGYKVTSLSGSVTIAGSVTIINAPGSGSTEIGAGDLQVGGALSVTNGAGVFQTHIIVEDMRIGGRLSVYHAGTLDTPYAGGAYIQASGHLEAGAISIVNARGNFSTVLVAGSGSAGAISIVNGPTTGASESAVTGTSILGQWQVERNISIVNGRGFYTGGLSGLPGEEGRFVAGGAISVVTGAGSYGFLIDVEHLAAGSLTISNGSSPGPVSNLITVGSMDITGAVRITNGHAASHAYEDLVTHRIEANGSVALGSLTIRNGNGSSASVLAGDSVTVRGGVSITSGVSSLYPTWYVINGDIIDIRGALSIRTAGGDTDTAITGEDIRLSRVSLNFGGLGGDLVALGGGAAIAVTGGIDIRTNASYPLGYEQYHTGSQVTIGSRVGSGAATALDLQGGIRFTGAAEGLLSIHGDGRISGGVTAQRGGVGVFISGHRDHEGSLEVSGAVSVSGSGVSLQVADASFDTVSLRGGIHASVFEADEVRFSGAVLLDCRPGALYSATIDDATFGGSLTIFGGGSADTVDIETRVHLPGATTFHGPVKIILGGGDDTLRLSGSAPAQHASFHRATFHGGPGTDTLEPVPNLIYASPPSITSFLP